jgi:hypothetical protein
MNESTEPPLPEEWTMKLTRFEARGRIWCFDSNGKRHFVNKFTHVLIEGNLESDGETAYRLDDGATVVFVADGVYRVIESGMELRCGKEGS